MARQLTRRESEVSPWRELGPLEAFRREMDQLFSRFLGGEEDSWSFGAPSLDLSETDSEVEVRMETPGLKPEEIDIRLDRDLLTVRGEHAEEKKEEDEGRRYHRIERRSGRFSRTVRLPAAVQENQIDAELKDGLLTIRMPKAEESKAHRVPVKG